MKILISLLLATGVGVVCRVAGIPLPAPPVIVGALLVLSMTLGYLAAVRIAGDRPKDNQRLCGGLTGSAKAKEAWSDDVSNYRIFAAAYNRPRMSLVRPAASSTPQLVGALLVVAMTVGFVGTDLFLQ